MRVKGILRAGRIARSAAMEARLSSRPYSDYIADRGYDNLPAWIENAVRAAGR